MVQGESRFWKVFKRNKLAVLSLAFIILSFIVSLFAYWIIPDRSPNSNEQFSTIALQKPGFKTNVIHLPKEGKAERQSLINVLLKGKKPHYESIAFKSIEYDSDEVILVNHYNRKDIVQYSRFGINNFSTAEKDILPYIKKRTFILGTDKFGRDIFSRIILGIRVSIFVGALAVFISLFVGIFMGSVAGYFGGKIDQIIMLIINVNWSIPTLLMVFAIVLAFDRGISVIFIAVGLTMWVEVARIVRGQVLVLKTEQFIMAAKSMGFSTFKIITTHILPNILGPVLVIAAANFSTAVLVEAGLSYLGFGVEPPMPSIGNMLNEHYGYAMTGKVFLAIVPAITLMILVLSFNLVGSGLRDAFDVKRQDS